MRGGKYIRGSRAKRRGYHSQRNGTPSCWANFSRCRACMAISYRTPIWLHWLWNTGLRCAPQTVILRGFAVCVGLTRSHPEDRGPFRKSYRDVLMVEPGQDWDGENDTGPLDCPTQGLRSKNSAQVRLAENQHS